MYIQLALAGGAIAMPEIIIPPYVLAGTAWGGALEGGLPIGQHLRLDPSLAAVWAA